MGNDKLDQMLQQGIYGTPELRPQEKQLFLGTFAERIRLALTNGQVYKKGMYPEAERLMERSSSVHLIINGTLPYHAYNNYVKKAGETNTPFTIHNDFHETPIGIVLAEETAVHQDPDIFVRDDHYEEELGGEN
ncbi:YueI family protein [Alkalicoccus urumqiensis]|nr:YueI family protein [Alkalicoccus urumqiensis]